MSRPVTAGDAQNALKAVARGRRRVRGEIGVPFSYWLAVAVGWAGVGAVTDLGTTRLTVAASLAFGTAHAAFAWHAASGRHRSARVSLRADVAGPWRGCWFRPGSSS